MKLGDLVKVKECFPELERHWDREPCGCFFCHNESTRIGVVMKRHAHEVDDDDEVVLEYWDVLFDCGMWQVYRSDFSCGEVVVVSEAKCKS